MGHSIIPSAHPHFSKLTSQITVMKFSGLSITAVYYLCGSVASDRETIPSVQICYILSCTKLTLKSIIDLVLYFPFHKDEILNHSWFSNGGPGCGGRSSPQPPKKSHSQSRLKFLVRSCTSHSCHSLQTRGWDSILKNQEVSWYSLEIQDYFLSFDLQAWFSLISNPCQQLLDLSNGLSRVQTLNMNVLSKFLHLEI